jgi:L-alanine-DL-glutamate epimerase-like enolase superfamily enzyme
VLQEIEQARDAVERGAGREDLLEVLPAGPARSALDCALWDLESRIAQVPVWSLAGLPPPRPTTTAYTLRAGHAPQMADDARRNAERPLLKIKLEGARASGCVEAVRNAAPRATLIADANGSLSPDLLQEVIETCERNGVEMLEQPLPRGSDDALRGVEHTIAVCADESFLDRSSLSAVVGRYDMVNVKLDKTGGLTEALLSIAAARREGLRLMVGCMLGTSLAMAPALLLASQAEHVDLDGPLMLGRGSDRRVALRREHRAPAGRASGDGRMIIDIPRPYLLSRRRRTSFLRRRPSASGTGAARTASGSCACCHGASTSGLRT